MNTLATARSYQDLLVPEAAPAPYEYATLFAGEGWLARRRAKRRFELLKKLDVKLRTMLAPDERVFFVTSGTTATFAEQFFVGLAATYLNRRALVFTTHRLLLVQIDSRKRPRELVSQMRYDQIASVRSTWNGICEVKLHGGVKYKFQQVPKAERKFLHQFLADVVKPVPGAGGTTGQVELLCPKCFVVVPGHPASCPTCHAPFKSAKKAAMLSLVFPGLGDFYLGHRGFAALELIGSAFLWLALVVLPLMDGGAVDADTGELVPLNGIYWAMAAVIIAMAHLIDSSMTRHFAKKGHHPE